MHFVIDNSVVLLWLFGDRSLEDIEYAERILEILKAESNMAMAPAIWPLEVGNVIVRAEARNLLQEARSAEFLGILHEMPIEIEVRTTERALTDTLQLARRHNLQPTMLPILSSPCVRVCHWQRTMPSCVRL
jgi:hypothetical protein